MEDGYLGLFFIEKITEVLMIIFSILWVAEKGWVEYVLCNKKKREASIHSPLTLFNYQWKLHRQSETHNKLWSFAFTKPLIELSSPLWLRNPATVADRQLFFKTPLAKCSASLEVTLLYHKIVRMSTIILKYLIN